MTRETTVGVVVSCSFLCLVGLVLANKMREGEHKDETVSEEQITSALEEPKEVPEGSATSVAVPPMSSGGVIPGGPHFGPVPARETPHLVPPPSSPIVPV